jgi:hypothetical protein
MLSREPMFPEPLNVGSPQNADDFPILIPATRSAAAIARDATYGGHQLKARSTSPNPKAECDAATWTSCVLGTV